MSVKLNAHGPFVIEDIQFPDTLGPVPDEPVRRNELGVHHIRPEFLAQIPEGWIGNILHGCKEQGLVTKIQIVYSHGV